MVRGIKRTRGYGSIFFFSLSVPLTYYNILFSDPAPYFTLCTYGCFSIESCSTNDQNIGTMLSLCLIIALCSLLTVEVLGILFSLEFLSLSPDQLQLMIEEVRERYKKEAKAKSGEEDDDEEDQEKEKTSEKEFEIHSDNENAEKTKPPLVSFRNHMSVVTVHDDDKLQQEFEEVVITKRPYDYLH